MKMNRGLHKNRSSMHMKASATAAALVFIVVSMLTEQSQAAGMVEVQPNRAVLNEGQKAELLCKYGRKIDYCRIEIPGKDKALNLSPEFSKTPGFSYNGAGLDVGDCGVTIERADVTLNGKVKCSMGAQGDEYEGFIELVVAMRPHPPEIEALTKSDQHGAYNLDNKFVARCTVRDGRPAANISWFIDDMPVNQNLNPPEIIESNSDRNITLSTTTQILQRYLTPEDDNKLLICRATHQADGGQPLEGKMLLRVKYGPVPQPEMTVYGLYLEHTAMVNVTIRANPAPITEWTIEGVAIPQGQQNGRYSAYEPVNAGNGFYNVTLAIAGLTLQDTTKTYSLKASNELGVNDYTVRISSLATPPSSGLDIGSIVGIAVAVAILVIVVLLVGFARATGRWCFGGKKSKSPTSETHDDGGTSTQQPGPNVALLESNTECLAPNGVIIVPPNNHNNNNNNTSKNNTSNGNQKNMNDSRQRNSSLMTPTTATSMGSDDDSFEYATDRESGVSLTFKGVRNSTNSRQSTATTASDELARERQHQPEGVELLNGSNHQLARPESRCTRWIPKDQRELLERQAKLLANRIQKPVETEF